MKQVYFDAGDFAVACLCKAGSSSLSRAIIKRYHPRIEGMLTTPPGTGRGTAYPSGVNPDNRRNHAICPKADPQDKTSVLIVLRDPLERFCSAVRESRRWSVDETLDKLESSEEERLLLFARVSPYVVPGKTKFFNFPSGLEALRVLADLPPLLDIDGGHTLPKPTLTPSQEDRVRKYYSDDIALYEKEVSQK